MQMHVDEELWEAVEQCLANSELGDKEFGLIGVLDGNHVWAVDGNEVKIRPDRKDDEAIHMDFVEGGNDLEAAWVKRDFGQHVLIIDGHIGKECWPYILYHEAYERRMMAKGWTYARAHTAANGGERQLRMRAT